MKTILCYGDSLTWGYDPRDGTRYPFDQRWPGALEQELGSGFRVIEEALSGRTTVADSPLLPNRSGLKMLEPLLESHAPIDLCILMLGTNDAASGYRLSASDVACGCLALIWAIEKSQAGPGRFGSGDSFDRSPSAGHAVRNDGTLLQRRREDVKGASEGLQDGSRFIRVPFSRCLESMLSRVRSMGCIWTPKRTAFWLWKSRRS